MKRFVFLVFTTVILSSSFVQTVSAQKGRSTELKVSAKAERSKKAADAKAQKNRDARSPKVVKEEKRTILKKVERPTLQLGEFERRGVELQVAEKRQELIRYLNDILDSNPSKEEKPDLLFQKAELYLEESQFHEFEGMKAEDDAFKAKEDGKKREAKKYNKVKKSELKVAKNWMKDAVLILQEIESNHKKYDRMPQVLNAMAHAFWQVRSYTKGLDIYRKIVKKYPKSQYVPHAWLAFGEYYFTLAPESKRDVKKALSSYVEAAKDKKSDIYGYAIYMQGWCQYNQSKYSVAAQKFKAVALMAKKSSKKGEIKLSKEAKKDFVLAYSHYGAPETAARSFRALTSDKTDLRKMLERLANIFYGNGMDSKAIIAFRQLMRSDRNNTRNPLYQSKVVKLASRQGNKSAVVRESQVLVKEYKRVRKKFTSMKKGDEQYEAVRADLESADNVSDNILRFLATTWHNEAKKTRDNETYIYSSQLYKSYLDLFSARKEAYEIRFFYAELLYKLEKFENAAEQYLLVFKADPKGRWSQDAAEEAVRSYEEVVKDYDRQNKRKKLSVKALRKKRKIPRVKKKFADICQNYVKAYPDGKLAVESRYRVARIHYDFSHFDISTKEFIQIIEKNPAHERAEQSANLLLDTYNIQEDWASLNKYARIFYKNKDLTKNADFKTSLRQIVEESSFKLISEFERQKKFVQAAEKYLDFSQEFPKSPLADKAMVNSATMFTRAGRLKRAVEVRRQFINKYPDSPLAVEQVLAVASAYEQTVDYKNAAKWLEIFAKKQVSDPRAKDALLNASIYHEGVGNISKAVEDRELYLATYPKEKNIEKIAFSIPLSLEDSGKTKKAIEAYLNFVSTYKNKFPGRAVLAQYKAERLLKKQGRRSRSKHEKQLRNLKALVKSLSRKIRSGSNKDNAAPALSYLAFLNAEEVSDKYRKLKIHSPDNPRKFKQTMLEKRKQKEKVYKVFLNVVKIGDPEWAVASLHEIALSNQHFVDVVQSIPAPREFNEEQSQMFSDQLSEQVLPIEEEASKAMKLCLDKSSEFGVFNKWTKKCLKFLEENRPNSFPANKDELAPSLNMKVPFSLSGNGLVVKLPKKNEIPKSHPSTAPPVPKASTKQINSKIDFIKNETKTENKTEDEEFSLSEGDL